MLLYVCNVRIYVCSSCRICNVRIHLGVKGVCNICTLPGQLICVHTNNFLLKAFFCYVVFVGQDVYIIGVMYLATKFCSAERLPCSTLVVQLRISYKTIRFS